MNAVSDQDLELIEEHLDAALAPGEAEALCARLGDEPELAAALERLQAQREARAAVWRALEPTEAQAQRLAAQVIAAARRQSLWPRVRRFTHFGTAAAACLLLGFFMGWAGRRGAPDVAPAGFGAAPVSEMINPAVVTPPEPATLGVLISEIRYEDPPHQPMPMLLVRRVLPGSPAAGAGLREGDLLLTLDGQSVHDIRTLTAALAGRDGTRVLRILRGDEVREIAIELQPQP